MKHSFSAKEKKKSVDKQTTETGKTYSGNHVRHFMEDSYTYKKGAAVKGTEHHGYEVDHELSSRRAQVYYNPTTGDSVVVHRGTADLNDWMTDARYTLFGSKDLDRFDHSKKVQKSAEEKYGKERVTTMGHSLGGALAEDSASKESKVITYNKAAVDPNKKIKENQTDIRSHNDIVSKISRSHQGGAHIEFKSGTKDIVKAHGLDRLKRIEDQEF